MPTNRASSLLGREVRFRGIRLGVVADVLVDLASRRALGYDVFCGDESRRFLPLAACDLVDDFVDVGSPLVLLDDPFYRDRATSLTSVRGSATRRGATEVGVLRDLVVADDGTVVGAVLEAHGRVAELPLDPAFVFGGEPLRPAV